MTKFQRTTIMKHMFKQTADIVDEEGLILSCEIKRWIVSAL